MRARHATCLALACVLSAPPFARNMSAMSFLVLDRLSKSYGGTRVLDGVSIDIGEGEFLSLLGPSGCGKTTTLRIVAGLVAPDAGTLTLRGKPLTGVPPHRRNMGVVFQSYALFPHLTAARNVAYGLRMRGLPREDIGKRTQAALDLVGLGTLGARYPSQLSGGQQQRVALARALVIEPDVLLLDEPLSNLDATLRAEMRDEISRLRRTLGIATIFVTHDQAEAMATSDRIIVMNAGRIVEAATPERLSEAPTRAFTARFLGGRTILAGAPGEGGFVTRGGLRIARAADAGGATHVVLRANRLGLGAANPAPMALDTQARVVSSIFLGEARQLRVAVGAEEIAVTLDAGAPSFAPGDGVRLTAPASAVQFLNDAQ